MHHRQTFGAASERTQCSRILHQTSRMGLLIGCDKTQQEGAKRPSTNRWRSTMDRFTRRKRREKMACYDKWFCSQAFCLDRYICPCHFEMKMEAKSSVLFNLNLSALIMFALLIIAPNRQCTQACRRRELLTCRRQI